MGSDSFQFHLWRFGWYQHRSTCINIYHRFLCFGRYQQRVTSIVKSLYRLIGTIPTMCVFRRKIPLFRLYETERLDVGFGKVNFRLVVCKIRDLHRLLF